VTSTGSRTRYGAVDATRGLALLGSATGTSLLWLGARQLGPGYRPLAAGPLDRSVDLVTALLVDNRVLAVFALLLGYGLAVRLGGPGQLQPPASGPGRDAELGRAVRRATVLLGLGALHAALLLDADVLATLAVVTVLAVPLVGARSRTHVGVGLLVVPALLIHGAADGLGGSAGFPDPPADYLLSVVDRVGTWLLGLVLLPFTQLGLLLPAVAGIRLARAGWLAEPAAHRRGLGVVGAVATAVGLLGALPYARAVSAGAQGDVTVTVQAGALSSLTGPVAAVGAVCLTVLLLDLLAASRATAALALLGRHSLPLYLGQSLVLALVLAPWAGGLGARWGSADVVGLGIALWTLCLLAAVLVRPRPERPEGEGRRWRGGGSGQPTDRQGLARSSAT